MKYAGFRGEFILGLVACAAVLGVALYMEFSMGLDPCMLCMSQRFVYLAIAFVFMMAALHNPYFGGHKRYGFLLFSGHGARNSPTLLTKPASRSGSRLWPRL